MITYYDIRAARNAMRALQNKPMKHRNLDIHYSLPKVYILAASLSEISGNLVAIYFGSTNALSHSHLAPISGQSFW